MHSPSHASAMGAKVMKRNSRTSRTKDSMEVVKVGGERKRRGGAEKEGISFPQPMADVESCEKPTFEPRETHPAAIIWKGNHS